MCLVHLTPELSRARSAVGLNELLDIIYQLT